MTVSALHPARRPVDRLGVALSGLCAAHCLASPILLVALGGLPHGVHEVVHPVLAVVLTPVTLRAMRPTSAAWLGAGIGAVWLGVAAHAVVPEAVGTALTLLGSVLLVVGHRRNGCLSWQRDVNDRLGATGAEPERGAPSALPPAARFRLGAAPGWSAEVLFPPD